MSQQGDLFTFECLNLRSKRLLAASSVQPEECALCFVQEEVRIVVVQADVDETSQYRLCAIVHCRLICDIVSASQRQRADSC